LSPRCHDFVSIVRDPFGDEYQPESLTDWPLVALSQERSGQRAAYK
jgi:hypothetical protein